MTREACCRCEWSENCNLVGGEAIFVSMWMKLCILIPFFACSFIFTDGS